jgi:MoxR-like ATPase
MLYISNSRVSIIFSVKNDDASIVNIENIVLFDLQPKYLLVDEIEHLKPEYQIMLLSLMKTGILTQTMHKKVRQTYLKTYLYH